MLNVGLGVLGILLPGMPATVFLLIAGWCFARSSPRLSRWLDEHPRLGPYLRMARTRSMPRRARILTIGAIWIGIGTSLALRPDAAAWWRWGLLAAGAVGSVCVALMRGRPSGVRVQPAGSIVR